MAAWKNIDFDFGVHKNHPTHLSHHLALVLRRDTLDQAEVGDFRRAQLDRSSLSLLSSDNTIAEEEEDVLQV